MSRLRHRSTLPLFVARIGTDHANDSFAANNLAILAKFLNRCTDFHIKFVSAFTTIRPTDKS